jgi:hypothetical protein
MSNTLDIYISFPVENDWAFDKLRKHFDCIEAIEEAFNIEFSCGDGKFLSDHWKWSKSRNGLSASTSDEELEKYDGKVCLLTPPRLLPIKMSMAEEQMLPDKDYRFTIKYFPKFKEEVYYINRKERGRKVVG